MPMAPSTAVLFLLYGVAICLRARTPLSRRACWASVAMVCLGTVVALLLLTLGCLDIHWTAEHLGLNTTGTVGGTPRGYMSPVAAISFLLASVSFLASLSRPATRPWRAALALGSAGVLLGACFIFLLAYLYGTPLLYGRMFIPPALNTILAFVTLGLALLALAGVGGLFDRLPRDNSRAAFAFVLILLLLAAGIVASGYIYYRSYEERYRAGVELQLSSLAKLKVEELVQWRKERLGDATIFLNNSAFSALVRRFFEKPADDDAQRQLLNWLGKYPALGDYNQVSLLDAQGVNRLSVASGQSFMSSVVSQRTPEALRSGQVMFQDLYRNEHDQRIYLATVVPLFDERDGRPLGILGLRIDPEIFLYPFIKRWPTPNRTAETLLVRKDGNEAVYLHDLRYQTNTALSSRAPLDRIALPAAQAALGRKGVMEGMDYRGVPVLAALRTVPDSPWSLVAKMDIAEVYEPLRAQLWQVAVMIGVLIFGAGAVVGLVWRRQRVQFYRTQLEAKEAYARLGAIVESSEAAIIGKNLDGTITSWNTGAEHIYGYSAAEAVGKPIAILIPADHQDDFPQLAEKIKRGEAVKHYETERIRKNGERIWMSLTVSPVKDQTGAIVGASIVGRDITERKAREREIERLTRLYATLSQMNEIIVRVKSREELFQEVCRVVADFGGFKMAWIGRRDRETQQVVPVARAGEDASYLDKVKVYADSRPEGRGPTGHCISGDWPCVFNDFFNAPEALPWHEAALAHGFRSVAAFPIHFKGEVWGALTIYDKEENAFKEKEISLLQEAVVDISYAMETLDKETQRQAAEAALKASELRYRRLFESAKDGILILDAETGMVVDVNPFLIVLLGYSREAFLEKKIWELGFFKDIVANQDNFVELQQKQYIRYDNKPLETKDGRRIQVEFVSNVYLVNGRKVIQCNIRDITEREQAAKALRESEEKHRLLFESSRDAILTVEPSSWRFTSGNPAALKMFGAKSEEEFVSIGPLDLSPERQPDGRASAEKAREMMEAALCEGSHFFEWMHRRIGGEEFPADVLLTRMERSGKAIIQASVRDITTRKQAEESHTRLATAADQAAETIVITDANGVILYANPAFEKITGYTREEAIGQNPRILKSGQHDAEFYRRMWAVLATGKVWSGHIINKRKDGTLYQEEASISPVHDAAGKVVNYVAVKRDVTREVAMENQLRQAQKMEAIGTLAGGVAHEINNPINGIMNYAQLLTDGLPADSPLLKFSASILKETNRVSEIVRNLLAFARQNPQHRSPANLNDIIQNVLTLVQSVIRHDQITLTVEVPEGLPQMECRSQQLEQVLLNLLTNARDALNEKYPAYHKDKIIRVTARLFERDGARWIRTTVEDHANGIPEGIRDRILDPFFTTKAAGKGTGLGLSISHGIVKEHGGELHFETETGRGTRFHMDLPVKGEK